MNRRMSKKIRQGVLEIYLAMTPKGREANPFRPMYRRAKAAYQAARQRTRAPNVTIARIGKHQQIRSAKAGMAKRYADRDKRRAFRHERRLKKAA